MQQKIPAGNPNQATNRPVLLDAIDVTVRAIEGRARLYRNLVVAVSAVSVLSILLTVLFRLWLPLAGFVILVPLTGGYLFFDIHLVRRWRTGIVEMVCLRSLDQPTFLKTISGLRQLPPTALKAMLSTLPPGSAEARQQAPQLEPVISDAHFDALERKNQLKILRSTGLLTGALVCLVAGAFYESLAMLAFGGSLLILLLALGRR
jgi:hypothetical protein